MVELIDIGGSVSVGPLPRALRNAYLSSLPESAVSIGEKVSTLSTSLKQLYLSELFVVDKFESLMGTGEFLCRCRDSCVFSLTLFTRVGGTAD